MWENKTFIVSEGFIKENSCNKIAVTIKLRNKKFSYFVIYWLKI